MRMLERARAGMPGLLMISLAGCGSAVHDCASGDVVDTVREAMVDAMPYENYKERIGDRLKIDGIAMLEVDKDTNEFSCKADFSYDSPAGESTSGTLSYGVRQIVSDDAEFEIAYDEQGFKRFAFASIRSEMVQAATNLANDEARTYRAQAMAKLRRLSKAEATEQLNQRYQQDGNFPTIIPTQMDPERDDVEDYVVVAPWHGVPEGESQPRQTYLLTCVPQIPNGEGEKMVLLHSTVEALPNGVTPKEVTVTGSNITVTTASSERLEYSCSNSYIGKGHTGSPAQ